MDSLNLIAAFAVLLLFSCSTKTRNISDETNLISNLDQTNQNIFVKTEYNKGLNKMKPSNQTEVDQFDFLTYANEENFEKLLECHRKRYNQIGISKQIFLSDWYAHYKFFQQTQIEWINEQKNFTFKDKVPFSARIFISIIIFTLLICMSRSYTLPACFTNLF